MQAHVCINVRGWWGVAKNSVSTVLLHLEHASIPLLAALVLALVVLFAALALALVVLACLPLPIDNALAAAPTLIE